MNKHILVGVHITERAKHAGEVQGVFTTYGCSIRTRLGLHEADAGTCSPNGLIILEMTDDDVAVSEMMSALSALEGIEVQQMVFDHP